MDIVSFEPLVERLVELDRQLDAIDLAMSSGEGDALGLLDDAEALVGEGFLLMQLYMIERKGDEPAARAYACGPRHNSRYFAQVLNTAGNYRKHRGEWPADGTKWGNDQRRTVATFRDAGVVEPEFWLANLLFHLCKPDAARFATLLPRLIEWREAFDRLPEHVPITSAT